MPDHPPNQRQTYGVKKLLAALSCEASLRTVGLLQASWQLPLVPGKACVQDLTSNEQEFDTETAAPCLTRHLHSFANQKGFSPPNANDGIGTSDHPLSFMASQTKIHFPKKNLKTPPNQKSLDHNVQLFYKTIHIFCPFTFAQIQV